MFKPLKFTQINEISAPPDKVAQAFMAPALLKSAIPRCTDLREIAPGKFWVAADVGILNMTFQISGMITVKADPQKVGVSGNLRTRNFAIGTLESDLTLTGKGKGTVIAASTRLMPLRQHNVFVQRAIVVIGKSLMTSFLGKLGTIVKD